MNVSCNAVYTYYYHTYTSDHFCPYTMYICDIYTFMRFFFTCMWWIQHFNSSALRTICSDAVNLREDASSACLSFSSNAQACQTSDWNFENSPKKIWHSIFASNFFNFSWKPPLLWTALPTQCAALCFPERVSHCNPKSNPRKKSAPVKLLWPAPLPCATNKWHWLSNQSIQISNWTRFNVPNPFKSSESTGMWKGLERKPRCLQERRETRYFCHGLWGFLADVSHTTRPRARNAAWRCKTKHWKEIPVCCNMKPNMKPKMIKMCLLQLCSFFIGDFGLQNVSLRSIQQQWTLPALPTSHLLTCLGHEHAQKATGPVFWISLPSPCGVPWFPVKTWVKQEINPWLHVPN